MTPEEKQNLIIQLFPNISTQLRTLLGNLHFAGAALAPAEARESDPALDAKAAVFDQSYYRLLRLVNNLTMAACLQESEPLPLRDTDLVALVQEVCDQAQSLARLLGLQLSFVCEMESHVCAVSREPLEQLLLHLLSNAFKFTPAGGNVTIMLKLAASNVVLSVSDTGAGIPSERLPVLFGLYLHGDLMNPPPHGLGLGLALCRKIAEGMGGSIMAESRLGVGTCITLSLPDRVTGISGVSDLPFDYAGGFNPTLLALADALPPRAFRVTEQD